ncbi:hypothetical protein INT48_006326, partial [Thamnidium elegans]
MAHSDSSLYCDKDVVQDKPIEIKIKGEAKRHQNQIDKEEKILKSSIKLFLEAKKKITLYQQKRETLLEKEILPTIRKEIEMIHM